MKMPLLPPADAYDLKQMIVGIYYHSPNHLRAKI